MSIYAVGTNVVMSTWALGEVTNWENCSGLLPDFRTRLNRYHHWIILYYAGRWGWGGGVLSKTNPTEEKLGNWAVVQTCECNCRTVTKESYFGNTAGRLNSQSHNEGVYEKRFLAIGKSTVLFNSLATGLNICILVYPLYEMWTFYKQNEMTLWNTQHLVKK